MPMQYYRELVSDAFARYPRFAGNIELPELERADQTNATGTGTELNGILGSRPRSQQWRFSRTSLTSIASGTSGNTGTDNESVVSQTNKLLSDLSSTGLKGTGTLEGKAQKNQKPEKAAAEPPKKQTQIGAQNRVGTAISFAGQQPPNSVAPSRRESEASGDGSLVGSGIVWINMETNTQRATAGLLERADETRRVRNLRAAVQRAVVPKFDRLVNQMEARRSHSLSRERSFISLGSSRDPSRYLILTGRAHSRVAPKGYKLRSAREPVFREDTMATQINWESTLASTVNRERTVIPSEKEANREASRGLHRPMLTPRRVAPLKAHESRAAYISKLEAEDELFTRIQSSQNSRMRQSSRNRPVLVVDRSTKALTIVPAAPPRCKSAVQVNQSFVNPYTYYMRHIEGTCKINPVPSFSSIATPQDDALNFHIPKWPSGIY